MNRVGKYVCSGAVALSAMAAPAAAFICPEHPNRRAELLAHFQSIVESHQRYIVVYGTVTATGPERRQGGVASLPMRIEGLQLGADGFASPVTHDFRRRVICDQLPGALAEDCQVGYAPREADVLLFLRRDGSAFVLDHMACGGRAFSAVDGALRAAIEACHSEGICQ